MAIFTQDGYDELIREIEEANCRFKEMKQEKGDAGRGQDGWHSAAFQSTGNKERLLSKRLGELQRLASSAQIRSINEQNKVVELGVGVEVEYSDRSKRLVIIDGYRVRACRGRVSLHSPLGKALAGARVGEERSFKIGGNKKILKVLNIIPPSETHNLLPKK